MNFIVHLSLFGVLAVILIAVYLYRHWLENQDDPYIHLHNDTHDDGIINSQKVLGQRLDMIDKVKNGLLAATIAYAVAIAIMGIYWAWTSTNS
jgi:hypothetical protein